MANYSGLVTVDISSFDAFTNEILGNGYDVDFLYGFQCVDLPKLLAGNAGRSNPYWKSGNLGYARDGWLDIDSRNYNMAVYFTPVYNKRDVRKGDIVVLDATTSNPYGHVAFATTDWNNSITYAPLLGQNQVNPNPTTGHVTTITSVNISTFLGGFRFKDWNQQPANNGIYRKGNFPWVLYFRKLRNQ